MLSGLVTGVCKRSSIFPRITPSGIGITKADKATQRANRRA